MAENNVLLDTFNRGVQPGWRFLEGQINSEGWPYGVGTASEETYALWIPSGMLRTFLVQAQQVELDAGEWVALLFRATGTSMADLSGYELRLESDYKITWARWTGGVRAIVSQSTPAGPGWPLTITVHSTTTGIELLWAYDSTWAPPTPSVIVSTLSEAPQYASGYIGLAMSAGARVDAFFGTEAPVVYTSDCGAFAGEVFMADDGITYLGDFKHGYAIDAPLGFSRSMGYSYGIEDDNAISGWCGGMFGMFSIWWEAPYLEDGCYGKAINGYWNPDYSAQPLVPISILAGYVGNIGGHIMEDFTGPRGLEALPAMEILGSGWAQSQNMAFLGESGSKTEGNAGWPTFWSPATNSRWTFQCWAKAVPDPFGWVASGVNLRVGYGVPGGWAPWMIDVGPLQPYWTFYKVTLEIIDFGPYHGGPLLPLIGLSSSDMIFQTTHTVRWFNMHLNLTKSDARGRALIKCAHLYPEGAEMLVTGGLHLDDVSYRAG